MCRNVVSFHEWLEFSNLDGLSANLPLSKLNEIPVGAYSCG